MLPTTNFQATILSSLEITFIHTTCCFLLLFISSQINDIDCFCNFVIFHFIENFKYSEFNNFHTVGLNIRKPPLCTHTHQGFPIQATEIMGTRCLWFVTSQCDKANKLPSLIGRCWHVLLMVQLFKSLLHSEQFFYCSGQDLLGDYHLNFDFKICKILNYA